MGPMKRSGPLQRKTPLQSRTRVKPISAKKAGRKTARTKAVAIAARRDRYQCQAQHVWFHECWGGLSPHEPHKQSAGCDETDPDQILMVCWRVNCRIEDEPKWARGLGLSVHSWETWSHARDWADF